MDGERHSELQHQGRAGWGESIQDFREEPCFRLEDSEGESQGDVAGLLGTLEKEWWRQTPARKGMD